MASTIENESEILLGNKQLLAVFAVVAILLAVAFTSGYMLGKGSSEKKSSSDAASSPGAGETSGGPITQRLTPETDQSAKTEVVEARPGESVPEPAPSLPKPVTKPLAATTETDDEPVLGSRNPNAGAPKAGQFYVQVTAVSKKDAEATAEVLRQHDFKARIAPAPGSVAIYRVLVGPGKDAASLRSTEDQLRKIGYTKCFLQHY